MYVNNEHRIIKRCGTFKDEIQMGCSIDLCVGIQLCSGTGASKNTVFRELRPMEDFLEFRDKVKELVKASDVWSTFEYGEKLRDMLLSCRVKDKLDENTRLLFDMGYQG